jgi:hypothetical protein
MTSKERRILPLSAAWAFTVGALLIDVAAAGEPSAAPGIEQKITAGTHKAGAAIERAGEKTGVALEHAGKKTGAALAKAGRKTGEALEKANEHVQRAARATGSKAHELKQKLAQ